jgi:hypothetical protein
MLRRVLGSMAIAVTLAVTSQPAAQAAATPTPELKLTSYKVGVASPKTPATVCDYNYIDCGMVAIEATFKGLNKLPRPAGEFGPPEAELSALAEVTRVYGCADVRGKRLRDYDRTVSETAVFGTRRNSGLKFPRTGDTVSGTTYAFLDDKQPGHCPAGTTAMTYKITAKAIEVSLYSYVSEIPSADYKVSRRAQWTGAVPTPTGAPSVWGS